MADTVEQQDIRGLDIQKTVKGFALKEYIFKNDVQVASTDSDHIRWFQEEAADLTATSPQQTKNVSPLSQPANLEVSWTRNTSYFKKYSVEGTISMEDEKSAEINVVSRTLLRLTRNVASQVDSDIWDVMTESQSASNINSVTSTAAWDDTGQDPIDDILDAETAISNNHYSTKNAKLYLSPEDYKALVVWLISKGSDIPQFASKMAEGGNVKQILGYPIEISTNVTADYAVLAVPKTAVTFYQHTPITSVRIEDKGIGATYRVYELGLATLTDPKAVSLISNTQA